MAAVLKWPSVQVIFREDLIFLPVLMGKCWGLVVLICRRDVREYTRSGDVVMSDYLSVGYYDPKCNRRRAAMVEGIMQGLLVELACGREVQIVFSWGKRCPQVGALVDTGAYVCLFARQILKGFLKSEEWRLTDADVAKLRSDIVGHSFSDDQFFKA